MVELTSGEHKANQAIADASQAIQTIDGDRLQFNHEELIEAIHVLQSFVKQHYCHRLNPMDWSNWYTA